MNKKPMTQRIGTFFEGKGFYIVLFLCVAAIGISGFYLFNGLFNPAPQTLDTPSTQVAAPSEVQLPPATKVEPSVPPVSDTANAGTSGGAAEPEHQAPAKATVFTWPLRGTLAREFSLEVFAYDETMGDWRTHSGLDIEAALGTEVMAVSTGTVKEITEDALMGTTVVIDHGDGLESLYANLTKQPTVKVGDTVNPGSVIGAIGSTAIAESSSATHLHFEMSQGGKAVDPVAYFPEGA